MRQATRYEACPRVVSATRTTSCFLAVWCVFFGSAVAAFVPASVEQRLVNLLIFGLVPAFAFYVSGHILRLVLGSGCRLCELVAARLLRRLARIATGCTKTLTGCRAAIGRWTQRLSHPAGIACVSLQRRRRRLYNFAFDLSCLLVRTTARSIIRAQHLAARHRNSVRDLSGRRRFRFADDRRRGGSARAA